MWEAVKTRMSGRAVWEWAAVLIFVGALATFVVYATNPDGNVVITCDNGGSHVWGINETITYEAECTPCLGGCNAGFDENAGLTPSSDDYDNDPTTSVSGTKSDTGSYTLEAECPADGSHGEPSQDFKVVDIDYLSVDSVQKSNGAVVCCGKATSGNYTVTATLTPTATSGELRAGFMEWTKTAGDLDFTQVDQLTVTVPKTAAGYIRLEAQAGNYGTVYSIVLVVVQVDMDVKGAADGDEVSPGSFVLINDDDDDDDGTEDSVDSGGVTGENDLLEITFQPDLPPGTSDMETITVSWTGEDYIDVFSNSDRTGPLTSPQTYSLSASSQTIYVQGEDTGGSATFTVTYTSGATVTDSVVITPLEAISLYRDSSATKVLDDWSATATTQRSPKYMFGQEENIYIRLLGPSGLGDDRFQVQAKTTTADTTGVTIELSEISSGVYQNTVEDGELLRLSYGTQEDTPADYLMFPDENLLIVFLKINGDELGSTTDVVVDKGEFSTGIGRSYDSLLATPNPPDRTPLWTDAADTFEDDINDSGKGDLDWEPNEQLRLTYESASLGIIEQYLIGGGICRLGSKESDLIYFQTHGDSNGDLWETIPTQEDPDVEMMVNSFEPDESLGSYVWDNDVDWVIMKSCSILDHEGNGREEYARMTDVYADTHPHGVHGILSFEDPSLSDYDDYVAEFMEEIGARNEVMDCWINANSDAILGNQPYGIVYKSNFDEDVFMPASEGVSLNPDLATGVGGYLYCWRDASLTTGTDAFDDGVLQNRRMTVRLANGKTQELKAPIMAWNRSFDSAIARGCRFDLARLNPDGKDFTRATEWQSNLIKLTSNFEPDGVSVTKEQAAAIARGFIVQRGLPDAVLEVAQPMYFEKDGQKKIVGYTLVFKHHENGVLVAGDGMTMIVQADGVTLLGGLWHEIETVPGKEIAPMEFDQPAMEACARSIMRRFDGFKEVPGVKWVRPAYYVGDIIGNDEAPARAVWEVCFEGDRREYWDPAKREVIDLSTISKAQRGARVRNGQ